MAKNDEFKEKLAMLKRKRDHLVKMGATAKVRELEAQIEALLADKPGPKMVPSSRAETPEPVAASPVKKAVGRPRKTAVKSEPEKAE